MNADSGVYVSDCFGKHIIPLKLEYPPCKINIFMISICTYFHKFSKYFSIGLTGFVEWLDDPDDPDPFSACSHLQLMQKSFYKNIYTAQRTYNMYCVMKKYTHLYISLQHRFIYFDEVL